MRLKSALRFWKAQAGKEAKKRAEAAKAAPAQIVTRARVLKAHKRKRRTK